MAKIVIILIGSLAGNISTILLHFADYVTMQMSTNRDICSYVQKVDSFECFFEIFLNLVYYISTGLKLYS